MNRQQAKEIEYYDDCNIDKTVYDIVDQIYNDFESRVCGNCKHYRKFYFGGVVGWKTVCYQNRVTTEDGLCGYLESAPDFGCNKFERKDK